MSAFLDQTTAKKLALHSIAPVVKHLLLAVASFVSINIVEPAPLVHILANLVTILEVSLCATVRSNVLLVIQDFL